MPTITLNRKVFEKLAGKSIPLERMKERISYLGTDLESVDRNEIRVEVFPNRPDMLSEQGFARAFSAFIGQKKGIRKYTVRDSKEKVIIDGSLKNIRPYTACAIVKNLNFDDEKIRELVQIQEKLHITYGRNRKRAAIGIYPCEKIKPPIRFTAKKPESIRFTPLEAQREMTARQMLSQHPAGREYGKLLEGMALFPVFIDSAGKVLSVPPIINSHETGKISEGTKEVFIECSGFNFEVLSTCLNIIVTALADMGGSVYSMELVYPDKKRRTPDLKPRRMKVNRAYINQMLGVDLKESRLKELFERMGYDYNKGAVAVPAYRADVLHQADLMEDIAIAYGYENFEEEVPEVATIGEEDGFAAFCRKTAEILIGLGLIETNTYNLVDKKMQTRDCNLDMGVVELVDPVSSEYNSLRAWVVPSLLNVLRDNKHNEFPQNIFNIGSVFKKDKKGRTESGVEEAVRLCVALCGKKADFTSVKQVFDYLMRMLDLDYGIEEDSHPSFIKGRVGRGIVNKEKVAYIGEMAPQVLDNFDIDVPVACFELNLTDLYKTL